jgi:hypothetical protein
MATRITFLIAWALAACTLTACKEPVDRTQATNIVLQQVIAPDTTLKHAIAFMGSSPLKAGDRIEPMGWPERAETLQEDTWFCWIDAEPDAEFGHPVKFVFIPALGDPNPRVTDQQWYPVLNDTLRLFHKLEDRYNDSLVIHGLQKKVATPD